MLISGAGKQEEVSALVERIRAKARAFVAARAHRPSVVFPHFPRSARAKDKGGGVSKSAAKAKDDHTGKACDGWAAYRGDERMIRCHKAEAARGDLGDNSEQVSLDYCV